MRRFPFQRGSGGPRCLRLALLRALTGCAALLPCCHSSAGPRNGEPGDFVVVATLLTPRKDFAAAALGDEAILVAGGMPPATDSPPPFLRTAEVVDIGGKTVRRTRCDMLRPRARAAAVALPDGRALIVGGDSGNFVTIRETELYDPRTDCFEQGPSLLSQRIGTPQVVLLHDGRVLVLEGISQDGSVHGGAELLDAQLGGFTEVDRDLGLPREQGVPTVLADGRVLVSGGMVVSASGWMVPTDRALLFEPALDRFRELAARLGKAREGHASALLADGGSLIVGGSASAPLSDAEVFDPRSETFAPLGGRMAAPRVAHSAVALPNGDVVIVGGKPQYGQEPHRLVEVLCRGCEQFRELARTVLPVGIGHRSFALADGTVVVVRAAGDPPRDSVAHVEALPPLP